MSDDAPGHATDPPDGERYVHDPASFEDTDGGREVDPDRHGADPAGADREFGLRGWVLVGWLVVALVVVPAYLLVYPHAEATLSLFGLGFRDTYLFVPLLPALVLGALAVWATTRP